MAKTNCYDFHRPESLLKQFKFIIVSGVLTRAYGSVYVYNGFEWGDPWAVRRAWGDHAERSGATSVPGATMQNDLAVKEGNLTMGEDYTLSYRDTII